MSIQVSTKNRTQSRSEFDDGEWLVRPTLSIEEGLKWKTRRKNRENALLPRRENLTSLDQRDHVSHVLSYLRLADKWP